MGRNGGRRGSAEGGILTDAVPLRQACHSRESGNLETFAMGRLGIGRAALGSWCPMGVGDKLRGNDVGAVDSRFHGNDRWVGMVVGGNDGWAGMVGGDGWVGMGWAGMADGVALRKVAFLGCRGSAKPVIPAKAGI